jgi:hypothetical protein
MEYGSREGGVPECKLDGPLVDPLCPRNEQHDRQPQHPHVQEDEAQQRPARSKHKTSEEG